MPLQQWLIPAAPLPGDQSQSRDQQRDGGRQRYRNAGRRKFDFHCIHTRIQGTLRSAEPLGKYLSAAAHSIALSAGTHFWTQETQCR